MEIRSLIMTSCRMRLDATVKFYGISTSMRLLALVESCHSLIGVFESVTS